MLSYCLKWRKNMEIKNWRAAKTTKEKPMILSKYVVCDSKKSRLIKEQEASGLLLIDNSPFQGIPTIDSILQRYKINEIVNKFLLAGDKFMSEMHFRQPGFTYSACGSFTKNKERIYEFKETGDSRYISQKKLDKPCFLIEILKIFLKERL